MVSYRHIRWAIVVVALMQMACSPRALHEAQSVVAQADSLRAEGLMYSDSVRLDETYRTLDDWQWWAADDYAHACYHYGRLLREKDNPVEAMKCFINATHSRTHDYHILGRVYSNMGDICHMAGEFSLSYDMFERSADMFLRSNDSTAYFYALNDMAIEMVERGSSHNTKELLRTIREYSDSALRIKSLETEALLNQNTRNYQTVITLVDTLQAYGYSDAIGYIMKSRAFFYLDMYDSAMVYSQKVINISSNSNASIAAYYILTHDYTIGNDSLITLSSARADAQRAWAYSHGKFSMAAQLLARDFNREPDLKWLYAIISTILIIGGFVGIYVYRKRKHHQLLSQQIDDLESKNEANVVQMRAQIEERCAIFAASPELKKDLCWNDYEKMCDVVNQNFMLLARKLQHSHHLSEREIRLCVLTVLDMGYDRMADMLFYAPSGIGKYKMRIAKKIGTTSKNMRSFLIDIAIKN